MANALGYEVIIPKHVESGRAAISKGCLHLASKYACKNVELLKDIITEDTPLIGIEPSCILSFRDEYPRLVGEELRSQSEELAKHCLLYDEWLYEHRDLLGERLKAIGQEVEKMDIYLHGHCHQKALIGIEKTAACLRLIPHTEVHVIPSGCCGMAGSFGYEQEHYDTSMAIGNMVLFPALREIQKSPITNHQAPIVCAPGTSCRQQIKDGTCVTAYHPLQVLDQALNQSNA